MPSTESAATATRTLADLPGPKPWPLLGNLPVVGALFSTTSENVERRERLFLIRPKIVGVPDSNGVMRYLDTPSDIAAPLQVIPPEKDPGPQVRP